MDDFDSPWKEALDAYFESFVRLCLPTVDVEINWSRGYVMLDKELQQIVSEADEGRRYVDKLAKVWLRSGEEEWLLIHVEVQTQDESDFARRMFVYHTRIRELYHKDVLSVALLADDRPGWKPQVYRYECMKLCRVTFEFPAIKLLELANDEAKLLASGPFGVVAVAHVKALRTRKDDEGRQASKLQLIKNLYEAGLPVAEIRKLLRLIDWLMRLPKGLEQAFWQSVQNYVEEKRMPFVDFIERKSIELGVEQGLQQGLRQGILRALGMNLSLRFGEAGKAVAEQAESIGSIEMLETILEKAYLATALDEVQKLIVAPN